MEEKEEEWVVDKSTGDHPSSADRHGWISISPSLFQGVLSFLAGWMKMEEELGPDHRYSNSSPAARVFPT